VHDASEGGLLVAVAEMAFAGRLGAEVELSAVPFEGEGRDDVAVAFSESMTRWLVEVRPGAAEAFEAALAGWPSARIGRVVDGATLVVRGIGGEEVVDVTLEAVGRAWRGHVR
jgi:phosphoribosylformylglycinamidine synthase